MKSFQQKRGWRNIMHSKPVLAVLGVLVFIFAYSVFGFMGKMQATAENKKVAENKVAQLKKQQEELSFKIAKMNTPEGKEASIRERFPVAFAGEGVIVIVEKKDETKTPEKPSGGFFNFFKNLFK